MGVMIPVLDRVAGNGMVATVNHLASEAGVAMLRAGGSAADAAVAASAVLAVTEQHMCGMGGDLFALVSAPGEDGAPQCLNSSGRAGSGATAAAQALRDEGHERVPFRDDIRAVTIPGCVDGWVTLHARYGRLPLPEVLAPAVAYARDGYAPSFTARASWRFMGTLPGGDDYATDGPLVRRPRVADALDAIGTDGRAAYYQGDFGAGLLELGGGLYAKEDLAESQAAWCDALGVDAFGHRLWTAPPNSQGYLALASAWLADQIGLPDDPDDPLWAHVMVEASRLAACDRLAVLHDQADGGALVAPARLAPRLTAYDAGRAARIDGVFADGGTMCMAAVDQDRMGVTLIQSNASGWGCNIVEPNTRIFLQNRGMGFSLDPASPAVMAAGRKPPHTLSPMLVTQTDGALALALGTMGGDTQPQVLLQLLARILVHGETAEQAVSAARVVLASAAPGTGFDTWNENGAVRVRVEANAAVGWVDGLRDRGHIVEDAPAFDHGCGHAHVVQITNGVLRGGADPRSRSGAACGF